MVYACLAETIVLALEGSVSRILPSGATLEWEKVHEIYKLGLKHGMQLAAISGVNGVYSDADIARVRKLALEARKALRPAARQRKPTAKKSKTRKRANT